MVKPFLTYEEQLHKLKHEKHLLIPDEPFALEKLREVGYFTLIGGYKEPFRDPMTRVYLPGVSFEDIYALYEFDARLRELFFRELCRIEKMMRSMVSYAFCEQFGESQEAYLNPEHYNLTDRTRQTIQKLIQILGRLAQSNTEHEFIAYQRRVHHNVPLWVLLNAVTFGQLSKMYSVLPFRVRSQVSRNFAHANERSLGQYLKVLVLYRNACAHNERLFSHKVYSEIPDTPLHEKLGILRDGTQYTLGKRDLFAVVIAFCYLLPRDSFLAFKRLLKRLLSSYNKEDAAVDRDKLMSFMGFPKNWESITRYRL